MCSTGLKWPLGHHCPGRKAASHIPIIVITQKLLVELFSQKKTSNSEVIAITLILSEERGFSKQHQKFQVKMPGTCLWGEPKVKTCCPSAPSKFTELFGAASSASYGCHLRGRFLWILLWPDALWRGAAQTPPSHNQWESWALTLETNNSKRIKPLAGTSCVTSLPVPSNFLAFVSPCLVFLTL